MRDIIQPLSGEYAGRREILETLPFVEGWGVELGLLVDLAQRYGADVITQVDLGVREHRNRPLDELGPQAFAILLAALRKAGVDDVSPLARGAHAASTTSTAASRSPSKCANAHRCARSPPTAPASVRELAV